MNKPFKPEYANMTWDHTPAHFAAWCAGQTGYPLVDAAMRQLDATGWMPNRCRMVAASFLAKHLLQDWRLGERHFMSRLVDGDFASNSGGWGFAASTGADPQPYFRIFSPLRQADRFDPAGDYVRAWLPELAGLEGAAVHAPWDRAPPDRVAATGYPRPIVEHGAARERALRRYKEGLVRATR